MIEENKTITPLHRNRPLSLNISAINNHATVDSKATPNNNEQNSSHRKLFLNEDHLLIPSSKSKMTPSILKSSRADHNKSPNIHLQKMEKKVSIQLESAPEVKPQRSSLKRKGTGVEHGNPLMQIKETKDELFISGLTAESKEIEEDKAKELDFVVNEDKPIQESKFTQFTKYANQKRHSVDKKMHKLKKKETKHKIINDDGDSISNSKDSSFSSSSERSESSYESDHTHEDEDNDGMTYHAVTENGGSPTNYMKRTSKYFMDLIVSNNLHMEKMTDYDPIPLLFILIMNRFWDNLFKKPFESERSRVRNMIALQEIIYKYIANPMITLLIKIIEDPKLAN